MVREVSIDLLDVLNLTKKIVRIILIILHRKESLLTNLPKKKDSNYFRYKNKYIE